MIPNAITALALCMGLTGVSLGIRGEWEKALAAIDLTVMREVPSPANVEGE